MPVFKAQLAFVGITRGFAVLPPGGRILLRAREAQCICMGDKFSVSGVNEHSYYRSMNLLIELLHDARKRILAFSLLGTVTPSVGRNPESFSCSND
jgi:hypothetical protein